MLTYVDMMAATKLEGGLIERLERLTGDDGAGCLPGYADSADRIRRTPSFVRTIADARALADENRLLALTLLKRRGELCACEIQAATRLTHATVSHHMGLLVDAGLVTSRRRGKWLYYQLAREPEVTIR